MTPAPSVPRRAVGRRETVLFFDNDLPKWDRSAGSRRSWELLGIWRRLGYEVVLISKLCQGDVTRYLRALEDRGIEVQAPDAMSMSRQEKQRHRAAMGQPAVDVDLTTLVENINPTVVWVTTWDLASRNHQRIRRACPGVPVVVDSLDLHFLRHNRERALDGASDDDSYRDQELAAYRAADGVVAISDLEAERLRGLLPGQRIWVVPLVHQPVHDARPPTGRRGCVFVGNYHHEPNLDGIVWFLREILPRMEPARSPEPVTILGDGTPSHYKTIEDAARGHHAVQVLGFVPDLRPYLDSARVSIAPLRFGAGMKGKVAEALSYGLPVVGTSIAFEGMDCQEAVLMADEPEAFARAVVRLETDEALWCRAQAAGLDLVRSRWTPERTARRLQAIVDELSIVRQGDRES